jgi:hypothetical protein
MERFDGLNSMGTVRATGSSVLHLSTNFAFNMLTGNTEVECSETSPVNPHKLTPIFGMKDKSQRIICVSMQEYFDSMVGRTCKIHLEYD